MTSAERKARTTAIFHEALAKPAAQRLDYLKEASAGDATLFDRVMELLEAYAELATAVPSDEGDDRSSLALQSIDTLIDLGDRYENIRFIGEGGMGVVYRAYDKEIGKVVALKLLQPRLAADARIVERLRSETRLALDITHRNVCRIYGLERINGTLFIAMEYVDGETMRSILNRVKGVSVPQGLFWSLEICEALAAAHGKRIVHRDLKPENIMIDRDGHVKVMDFGIARSLETATHASQTIIGTPQYMSPEQAQGQAIEPTSDIYSLGLVLYELFTGIRPEPEHFFEPSVVNRNLPGHLDWAICRCLEKNPKDRFQTTDELSAALKADQGHGGTLEKSATTGRTKRVAAICAVLLALLISGFFVIRNRHVDMRQYDKINALEFSPDGRLLASAGEDRTVVLWDVASQHKVRVLADHVRAVNCIAFSENSRWLASGSSDKTIKVWEVSTGRLSHTLTDTKELMAVALSPDGRWLASATDEKVKVWDLPAGRVAQVLLHEDEVQELTFSHSGRLLASGGSDTTARVWDVETGRLVGGPLHHDDVVSDLRFSPDDRLLATGSYDKTIKLWSTVTWGVVQTLWLDERVWAVSFDAKGTTLLSVSEGGKVKLWQAPTWREVAHLTSNEKDKSSAWDFSPDGRTLAIGTADGRVVMQALPAPAPQ